MARNRWELEENRKKEKENPTQFANRVTSQLKANASAKNTSSKSSGKSSGGRSKKTTTKTTGNAAKVTKSTKSSSTGRSSGGFSNRSTVANSREEILSGGAARRRTNIDSRTGTNTSRGAQRESDLAQLKQNATDWWFADQPGRLRLQAENDAIRARHGWTYNDRTGHTFMTPGGYQIRLTGSVPKEVDRIRSYNDQNWLSTAGHNIGAGLAGISQGFYDTLDFLLPDQITPQALQDYIDQAESNAEGIRDSVRRYNYERGGTVGGVAGDLFQSAVGMLPQAVVALMSGGASTAGSLAGSADDAVSGVISALRNNAGAMTSFLSTVGTDYEQAKADGASDAEAALSAILSSAATAGIETLGGVDVPNVSTSRIRNAVRTALEEGTEEAAQGVVQNAVQGAVYDQSRPLTGSGGVFDAERMLQDFGGGALLGGAFGAARRPAGVNTKTPTTDANRVPDTQPQQRQTPDTIDIGGAQVERGASQITSPTAALSNDPVRANPQNIGFTPLNLESTLNRLNPMSTAATRAMRNIQRVYPQPTQRVQPTLQASQPQRIQPTLQTAQQTSQAAQPRVQPTIQTAQPTQQTAQPRVQPTLQTATQASMDALRRVANPELEGTTFGANTVGAAESGFKPKQKKSKVITNTFRNSQLFNSAEKQLLKILNDDGEAMYDVVSEPQSLHNAQERLEADYDGEVQYLSDKPNFSGEDNDTAMGVLSQKIKEARERGEPTDEAAKEKYDDVSSWVKMIKEKGTEGGQFIQSFAKYSRTPEGIIVQGQREIDAAIKYWQKKNPRQLKKLQRKGYLIWTNEDIMKSYDLMQKAEEAGVDTRQGLIYEAQAMRVIADRLPSSNKDKLVTLLMDNMLGNFRTLVARNAGGNALFAIPEGVRQQLIEAPLDAITSLFTKSRTTYFSPIKKTGAWFKGLGKGTADMASDIRHGVHTARSGEQNSVRAQQRTFRNKGLGRLGNLYDAGVGTMLEIGDRPFYEATYAAAMADLQKSRDRGRLTKDFEGKDFDTYAPQVARQAALEAVFQNDGLVARGLTKAAEAIGDISRGITGTGALRQSAIPFTKTPGNLAERAIEYSPLGGLKNLAQTAGEVKSGTFDQRRFVRETSRNLVGTLLFLAAGKLVEGGILGGQLSDDKDEKEAQKNAGMQDYAIKIGDNYYSYSWIPVIGPALAGSADFYQILNNTDKNLLDAMWEAAEGYVQSAVFEQSALSNLEEMFSGYGGTMDNIGSTLASVSSQLVPSLIRQVATAADPYERQTYVSGDTLQSQLNYLKSTIPGLRQTLPIKRDEQGNEKLSSQGRGLGSRILENMFLPAKITADQSNAVRDELLRLKKSTGEVSQFQNKVTYAVERDGQKVSLTPRQSMEYQRIYGQMSTQAIEDLMNSGVYDDLSDAEKVNIITKINSYAKTIADSNFIDVELDSAQQKAYDAQQIGIGLGTYYAFTDGVTNIKNVNKGSSDSSVQNVSDIVDMLETGGFADLTEEQKDYLFDAAGYSLASNPYHISSVEQESMDNSYYQKLSGEDLYYFRSLANEYEDAVDNGKTLDGWIAKAKLAADNGIVEPYQFVALKHALLYADADENGSYKQSEVTDAINSLSGLTQYQKAYLWQAQNKNWKKNPFGGADVYWPEKEESDSSPEAVISRRIGGMSGSSEEETGNEFVNPTKASNSVITSSYGRRNAPRTSQGYGSPNHGGIDIGGTGGNLNGQAADTIGSGTVATVGYDPSGYGNYVIIDHGNGYRTLYGHLQKATVQQGQTVNAGQQIGVIGSTGNSSAPHLHLSAWYNNEEIDPATIIPGY